MANQGMAISASDVQLKLAEVRVDPLSKEKAMRQFKLWNSKDKDVVANDKNVRLYCALRLLVGDGKLSIVTFKSHTKTHEQRLTSASPTSACGSGMPPFSLKLPGNTL